MKKNSGHEKVKTEQKKAPVSPEAFRIESKPELDNLRYDSVYSGDVAVYRRKFDCLGLRSSQVLKWNDGRSSTSKRKKKKGLSRAGRYFSERLNVEASEVLIPKSTKETPHIDSKLDYISIDSVSKKGNDGEDESLTAERHMTILTGEYNSSLLKDPHNVPLWLEFLSFQDQLLEWGHLPGESTENISRKRQALIERKISIYERALQHNPMSTDLLIGHMHLLREKLATEEIIKKWKDIVFLQPNNPRLWLGYIHFCQTNFASFKTSSVSSVYTKCLSTLASILEGDLKSHRPLPDTPSSMLAIFVLYCSYLRQAGLVEKAVACFQALVEFNLCVPQELEGDDIPLRSAKEFLEPYWDSGVPKFGEQGTLGWCGWSKLNQTSGSSAGERSLGILPDQVAVFAGECRPKEDGGESRLGGGTKGAEEKDEEDLESELVSSLSLPEAWYKLEEFRTTCNFSPWQPDIAKGESVEDCADPDRVVTYDDVAHTLFRISDQNLKLVLVLCFLSFLGVPVDEPNFSPASKYNTLRFEDLSEALPGPSSLLCSGEEVDSKCSCFPLGIGRTSPLAEFPSLLDLATDLSSQALNSASLSSSSLSTPSSNNFISLVCNQSMGLFVTIPYQTKIAQAWATHLLFNILKKCRVDLDEKKAVMRSLKSEIRSVEKVFKELLRLEQHRNNLSLWNSYALFQYSVGDFKGAKKLYLSLLGLLGEVPTTISCTLCECFMGLRWSLKDCSEGGIDHDLALHSLVCLSENKNAPFSGAVSPSRILKARSFFSLMFGKESSLVDSLERMLCCYYFEYLTRGLGKAHKLLNEWKKSHFKKSGHLGASNCLKTLYLRQLHLLERHSRSDPLVQPSLTRDLLQEALGIFPMDVETMAAFICHERQSFISGRMRRYFDKAVEETDSAVHWLFAVVAELDRFSRVTGKGRGIGQRGGSVEELSVGTVCRIMSLLSRATGSEVGRHCPLLWRLYMTIQVK